MFLLFTQIQTAWFANVPLEAKFGDDWLCMFCRFKKKSKQKSITLIKSETGKVILVEWHAI